jgi:thioredoxin-like negative regulator of GroEL
VVHGLEAQYWGKVDFVYIDREDPLNTEVVQQFGVRYQPVFFLLASDGTVVQEWAGYPGEDTLRETLDTYLATAS